VLFVYLLLASLHSECFQLLRLTVMNSEQY